VQKAHRVSLRSKFQEQVVASILDGAERVFARRGAHGATMDEIATSAGVAVGTLYNHFKDRQALLDRLLDSRRGILLDRLDATLASTAGAPFRAQLTALVTATLQHFTERRALFIIVLQSEQSMARKAEWTRAMNVRLERLVRRGLREGAVRTDRRELHARFLLGLIRAIFLHDALEIDDKPPASVAVQTAAVVDFFLRGAAA
jgi:AcrR family transcriptional regulator